MSLSIAAILAISCHAANPPAISTARNTPEPVEAAVDINSASAEELEKLPGVSRKIARQIIEHRAQYGRFRRAEHLMLVTGISEGRFRRMRHLIKVE